MVANLTLLELQKRLLKLSGTQFVGLTAVHEPDFVKRGNPFFGRVVKRSIVNGSINFRYQSTVQKQQIREGKPGEFVAGPRVWGQRVRGCPLVLHIGDDGIQLYLEIKVEKCDRQYFDAVTFEPIAETLISKYFRKRKRPTRQQLLKPVELRDYRLDHIAELRCGRESVRVAPLYWLLRNLGLKA
jgi:hypothetical protein